VDGVKNMVEKTEIEYIIQGINEEVTQGRYKGIIEMSKHAEFRVRKAAADSVEAAVINKIKIGVNYGLYEDLIIMSKDEDLSEALQKAAADSVEAAALNAIEKYDKGYYRSYKSLIKMSKDKNLSESMRETAGMKAVEVCIETVRWVIRDNIDNWETDDPLNLLTYEDYSNLIKMSKDAELSESIRKAAAGPIEALGMELVKKYAKSTYGSSRLKKMSEDNELPKSVQQAAANRVANPDRGVLSEGTIKPPAAQKKAQTPGLPKLKI
jgi:hypothetical protein